MYSYRTTLFFLITHVKTLMTTAFFPVYHTAPVVSKSTFADLVHALLGHTISFWTRGVVAITTVFVCVCVCADKGRWDCHLSLLLRTYDQTGPVFCVHKTNKQHG